MPTQCNQESLQFHPLVRRAVRGQFDGGTITTDAGGLLLREVEKRTRIIAQFAACVRDHRKAERIEHRVEELVAQRVYGLALGYEDLNDHEELRRDPLLAVLVEKPDPRGEKPAAGTRSEQGAGRQEHAEPVGVERRRGERGRALQEDRAGF